MKKIELVKNTIYTLVDDEDYKQYSSLKWVFDGGYCIGSMNNKKVLLHRLIMNCPPDMFVDHLNNNRLDNRKENPRICTHAENVRNVGLRRNNTSGYIGVVYKKERKTKHWRARAKYKGKTLHIGYYETPELAADAYDQFVLAKSEFSKTNKGLGLL